MSPLTDQIRVELTRRRSDAERQIHVLRTQAPQRLQSRLPVLLGAGVAILGVVALLLMRRRQTQTDKLRARVQRWGRTARRGYLVIGGGPTTRTAGARGRRWPRR
jgi:hypothetical protein